MLTIILICGNTCYYKQRKKSLRISLWLSLSLSMLLSLVSMLLLPEASSLSTYSLPMLLLPEASSLSTYSLPKRISWQRRSFRQKKHRDQRRNRVFQFQSKRISWQRRSFRQKKHRDQRRNRVFQFQSITFLEMVRFLRWVL